VATLPRPEPGTELAFERSGRATPRWRTYYLASRAELDESDLADAEVIYEPVTNRPEVLITFDTKGRRRFAELTRKNLGRKIAILVDGTITSAPVIQSEIAGGRSTITLGGGDPDQLHREAWQLVDRLRDGPALAGVKLVSQTFIVPRIASDRVMQLRAGAAILAGLLTLAIALAMGWRARA
jgi:preprotein translocase subunit SecD